MPILAVGLVILVAAALLIMLHRFSRWRREAWWRASTGSMVADTERGPVEWASDGPGGPNVVRDGDAPVVMLLHGGVGGWDQGMALGEDLRINETFTLLAPSRAGYLRTPLTTCATPAEAADALIALLDTFDVSRVAVIGISGGGPTALQVAIRHPDRVSALVMLAAISRFHTQPDRTTKSIPGRILFSNAGMWVLDLVCWLTFVQLSRLAPALVVKWFFRGSETYDPQTLARRVRHVMENPDQLAWMHKLIAYLLPLSLRRVGLDNDLAQFAAIEDYDLAAVTAPTLVVHGRHDGNVPFEHAEFVADGVAGAEPLTVECGHLIWMSEHAETVRAALLEFLGRHVGHAGAE